MKTLKLKFKESIEREVEITLPAYMKSICHFWEVTDEKTVIPSKNALGNGIIDDIKDIIYVNPTDFEMLENQKMKNQEKKQD